MALEGERRRARKTIQLPDGERIEIPVITSISFVDPQDRFQETIYTIDNTTTGARTVHVDQVHPTDTTTDPATQDDGTSLPVERVDVWPVLDATDRHQETQVTFDNVTGNDAIPPSFSNHARTHVYRYYQDPENQDDGGVWVDSELIDEFDVVDATDRHQETRVTLRNPERDDMAGQVDPADPDITEFGDDGDPLLPARTDPFQNIVNYSSGIYLLVMFDWHDFLTTNLGERCTAVGTPLPVHNVFTPGVQTQVVSADYITVELDDSDSTVFNSLLNAETSTSGQPERVVTEQFAGGYPKFPACHVCVGGIIPSPIYPPGDPEKPLGEPMACPPNPDPPGTFANPVSFEAFQISFLFDITPSDEANPTAQRTHIDFIITGLPSPRTAVYLERTVPGGMPPGKADEYITKGTSGMNFIAYTFDKSAVDLYLTDKVFPLRKKGITPTAPTAVDDTKAIFKTAVAQTGSTTNGWIDTSNNKHEGLSDAEFSTGDEMGTFGFNTGEGPVTLKLEFDKLTVIPAFAVTAETAKRPFAWPKEPINHIETAVVTGSIPSGTYTTEDIHTRQYEYFWKKDGSQQIPDPLETDFGVQPGETS